MKTKVYDLGLSEKESIVFQLRIMLPTVNFSDLENLYYVYKYQQTWKDDEDISETKSYLNYWVENDICPNLNAARAIETRLLEKGLIKQFKQHKSKKQKGLPLNIFNSLDPNNLKIQINIQVS